MNKLIRRPGRDHDPVRPWVWATLPLRQDPVEVVSYPIPALGHGTEIDQDATIMVRMVVGDPTSIQEVPFRDVACFNPSRHEWGLRPRRYYDQQNPSAFVFTDKCPAALERRL